MTGTWAPLAGAALGLAVATAAGLVSLRAGAQAAAIAQAQVVGLAYVVAGAIAWRRRPDNPTGLLLLAIGGAWYIVDFEATPAPAVAGLAFATRRVVNLLSVYLLLAYPSGRLGSRPHRLAIGFVAAVTAVQIPARLLLAERIPAVMPHLDRGTSLGCDCPNPFAIVSTPGLLESTERWTGILSVAGALLVMALVVVRLTAASPPMRRVLWPVLLGAMVRLAGSTASWSPATTDARTPRPGVSDPRH